MWYTEGFFSSGNKGFFELGPERSETKLQPCAAHILSAKRTFCSFRRSCSFCAVSDPLCNPESRRSTQRTTCGLRTVGTIRTIVCFWWTLTASTPSQTKAPGFWKNGGRVQFPEADGQAEAFHASELKCWMRCSTTQVITLEKVCGSLGVPLRQP